MSAVVGVLDSCGLATKDDFVTSVLVTKDGFARSDFVTCDSEADALVGDAFVLDVVAVGVLVLHDGIVKDEFAQGVMGGFAKAVGIRVVEVADEGVAKR